VPLNAKKAKQLESAPRGNSTARAAPDDQKRHLKAISRVRNQLMRQFLRGGDGPRGNTPAFQDGWDRIWGSKKGLTNG
jgi:hypothetical protein